MLLWKSSKKSENDQLVKTGFYDILVQFWIQPWNTSLRAIYCINRRTEVKIDQVSVSVTCKNTIFILSNIHIFDKKAKFRNWKPNYIRHDVLEILLASSQFWVKNVKIMHFARSKIITRSPMNKNLCIINSI